MMLGNTDNEWGRETGQRSPPIRDCRSRDRPQSQPTQGPRELGIHTPLTRAALGEHSFSELVWPVALYLGRVDSSVQSKPVGRPTRPSCHWSALKG